MSQRCRRCSTRCISAPKPRSDIHTWQLLRGIALSTLLGVGTELSLGDDESDLVAAIRESTQENVDRAGQRFVERNLDIPPTITVRPGWPLRVIVNRDIVLSPYKTAGMRPCPHTP